MPTMRLKKNDGTWDKVPVLGSYQAVLAANEATKDAEAAATNAQNAANEAQKIADDLGLVDEAVQTAVDSAKQANGDAVIASNKADVATAQANISTEKADIATAKAEAANTSAANAAQSYANADAIATQLTEYLNTKEELTAPAVDKTLLIEGAAADSKVVGELKSDLNYKEPLLLNLFDYTKVTLNKYLNGETEEYNDKTYISDFIPITELGNYNINLTSGTVSTYDTNKTYIRTLVLENHIFNVNDKSIKFIRFNGIIDTLPFDYLYYGDKYLGYIPYNVNGFEFVSEQVRPIQKIMGGVQKTNILLVNDGSTPYYQYDSNYRVTTYEIGEYKRCRYKAKAKTGGGALICFYKSNGDFIEYNTDIYDTLYDYDVYFTTPKDCAYIKTSGYFPNDGILYIEGYSTENCIYSGKTFLTVGDSRTWYDGEKFTDATKYDGITCNGYQYYLRNNLGVKTINYGASGYTTPQIYNGVKNTPLLADNIITMCGTNDWQKNTPLGNISDIGAEFNTETTLGAYQAMIEKFINQNSKVKLFVMGEFAGWNNNLNKEESAEINTKVRELCDLYSLPFLDLLNNGRLNKLNRGELYADSDSTNLFLHPNNDGWLLLSNTINSYILVN